MFAARYFAPRYFAPRFFPKIGANPAIPGFIRHYTGILIPNSTKKASDYTDFEPFDDFAPDPVSSASYTTATIDTGFDDEPRIAASIDAKMGPDQTGTPTTDFQIDTWLTDEDDPNDFESWTSGFASMRYLRARLVLSGIVGGSVPYIDSFVPVVDEPAATEQGETIDIEPGGTTVTFPTAFHTVPRITAIAHGAAGLYPTIESPTNSQVTFHVFDDSGTDVGGTIDYSATGE